MRLVPILLAALVLAACGEDEERAASPPPAAATDALTIEVTKAGEPRTFACGDGCDARAIAAVLAEARDATRACTELYGGPETAHVTGTLDGKAVDATITRNNGCGIADYEALFAALGERPPLARAG